MSSDYNRKSFRSDLGDANRQLDMGLINLDKWEDLAILYLQFLSNGHPRIAKKEAQLYGLYDKIDWTDSKCLKRK